VALAGGGSIWLVGVLGKLVFRKDAMGFGDVKYMAMVGAVMGWRGVLLSFVLACLAGSIFGIGKFIAVRRMGYVPFGPFLSLGALAMLFWTPTRQRRTQRLPSGHPPAPRLAVPALTNFPGFIRN